MMPRCASPPLATYKCRLFPVLVLVDTIELETIFTGPFIWKGEEGDENDTWAGLLQALPVSMSMMLQNSCESMDYEYYDETCGVYGPPSEIKSHFSLRILSLA